MKRIAVLTSGGDAPGMNAAIRSVVRVGIAEGLEVYGVEQGYAGLIAGRFVPMTVRSVGGIIGLGGTVLGSARCPEFRTEEGRRKAIEQMQAHGIDGLVVIGGGGSQTGSLLLHRMGFPVAGVASTIDNDLYGFDLTLGVDTALNTALESLDRIRSTASSHHRAFLVEVMGRDCGYLALMTALAGGAEVVVVPEVDVDPDAVARELREAYERGKLHAIVVVAEGARYNAAAMAEHFRERRDEVGFELRMTVLGHVQRGGTPTAFDRLLGTRAGAMAVKLLVEGRHGHIAGWLEGKVQALPLEEVVGKKRPLEPDLLSLAEVLAQ
ncbi:MAG: 6-phosphofructokinase [Firmicutes bacterium]|nr:6-phosphofructokinase [Bacillota bacterium]